MTAPGEGRGPRSIIIKTADDIKVMYDANQIVANTLKLVKDNIDVGVTTWDLDKIAEDFCISKSAKPAFKGYRGFPGSLCVSINE